MMKQRKSNADLKTSFVFSSVLNLRRKCPLDVDAKVEQKFLVFTKIAGI